MPEPFSVPPLDQVRQIQAELGALVATLETLLPPLRRLVIGLAVAHAALATEAHAPAAMPSLPTHNKE
jgi:hypothetical protein